MKKPDIKPQCEEAMPYYYDHLCGEREQIPEAVCAHIADCPYCQAEIQWLKDTDEQTKNSSPQNIQAALHTAQMQLHCALIDQPVRCSTIKSFLPMLAIPEMNVRISTPVTAHIQACSQCAQDLETLKELDLPFDQLCGISSLFVETCGEQKENEEESPASIPESYLEPLTEITQIMNRPDSGVVTIFHADHSSEQSPYRVEVVNSDPEMISSKEPGQSSKTIPLHRARRGFLKYAAAAAVFIAAIVLFKSPSVKATDISQIYEALKTVQNVMMTHYGVDTPEPNQQIWISRSLDIKLFKTQDEWTLFDIQHKIRKNKQELNSEIQLTELDKPTVEAVVKTMNIPWGLLPFNKTAELPDGAVWEKVQSDGSLPLNEQTEIYDLFWSEDSLGGKAIFYQWRCHLDFITKRPFKVEWWRKVPQEEEFKLTTFIEITYPTEQQVQDTIEQAGL